MSLHDGLAQTSKLQVEGYDLQPVRRVVTGHTQEGKAVVWKDEYGTPLPVTMKAGETAVFAHPWTIDSGKYDLNDDRDLSLLEDNTMLSNENGTIVRQDRLIGLWNSYVGVQIRDECAAYWFLVVFKGSKIILHLEEGRQVEIGHGDVVVQRGTIHVWENPTKEYARMYFILQSAKPFMVNGVMRSLLDRAFNRKADALVFSLAEWIASRCDGETSA